MEITQEMRDAAKVFPTSNCNKLSFSALVKVLEQVKPGGRKKQKKSNKTKVQRLLSDNLLDLMDGHSPFPLIRLLVPNCDRERPTYSIKEKVLAKLFCEAVGITLKSDEGLALVKFNNPQFVPVGLTNTVGDFPGVLEGILKSRGYAGNTLTIGDVNNRLSDLAQCSSGKERIDVIRSIYTNMSPTEIKWFARIVLKDLKIGVKHDKILAYIHPDGPDMFAKVSDLRLVLATLRDPTIKMIVALSLLQVFEPMLAKTAYSYDCTSKYKQGFYVEWKFDGERMLVHKRGDEVKCFTRNGKDYTPKYGAIIRPLVLRHVHCENCILDGEIMPWNDEAQRFGKFGSNQRVANEEKEGRSNGMWLCFVVFDCVWCDHPNFTSSDAEKNLPAKRGNLTDLDLKTRKEYLKWIIEPAPHRLYVSQATFVEGSSAHRAATLKKWMNEVIQQCQEGIMIKSISSPYICGGRLSKKIGHWIKLKPEYFDKMRDNLDLVVLAGYYGDGRSCSTKGRAGKISTFLLGVVNEDESTSLQPRFVTVGKVGTGYSFDDLKMIREKLEPYTEVFDNDATTPSEDYWMGWHASKKDDIPDVWYRPHARAIESSISSSLGSAPSSPMRSVSSVSSLEKPPSTADDTISATGASTPQRKQTRSMDYTRSPLVFEVTASELTICDTFNSGYVVRFPRVNRIRWLKPWTEAETLDQLQERFNEGKAFRKNDDGKAGGGKGGGTKRNGRKTKGGTLKRRRGIGGVVSNRSTKRAENVDIKSEVFDGFYIYILSSDQTFRQNVANMVQEHSGELHANFLGSKSDTPTDYVITDRPNTLHCRNIVKDDQVDVLSVLWLEECIRVGHRIDYARDEDYYYHLCQETREQNLKSEDPYGDSYTEFSKDAAELRRRLDRANKMLGASSASISSSVMCGQDHDLFCQMMSKPNSIWTSLKDEMDVDDYEMLVKNSESIFVRCHVHCPSSDDDTGSLCIALHDMVSGGAEISFAGVGECTHVLVNVKDVDSILAARSAMKSLRDASNVSIREVRIVTPEWVTHCSTVGRYTEPEQNGVHAPFPAHSNTA